MNVTIPYKEAIIPFLQSLDKDAAKIGAVNTIKITKNGLKGYNTDVHGFKHTLLPHLKKQHTNALILGTGGASKAVSFVLEELGIKHSFVSRSSGDNKLAYKDLNKVTIEKHTLLINTTPLGRGLPLPKSLPVDLNLPGRRWSDDPFSDFCCHPTLNRFLSQLLYRCLIDLGPNNGPKTNQKPIVQRCHVATHFLNILIIF